LISAGFIISWTVLIAPDLNPDITQAPWDLENDKQINDIDGFQYIYDSVGESKKIDIWTSYWYVVVQFIAN